MGILAHRFCDEITSSVAAQLLGLSLRTVERYCFIGHFKSAYQPGKSHWRLSRREVLIRIPKPNQ
jgi:hypothetical protein